MFPILITDFLLTQRLSFRKVNLEEKKKHQWFKDVTSIKCDRELGSVHLFGTTQQQKCAHIRLRV